MRKIAIVIAAAAGISAVAGTTYVYTTDTCLTDSCRVEKERQRQAEIDQEWKNISDNYKNKEVLISIVAEDFMPIIESHFNSLNSPMWRKIERNDQQCMDYLPAIGYSRACWEHHYPEKLRLERRISANLRASQEMVESLESLEKDVQRLNQSFAILNPEINHNDAIEIRRINDEFDRNFMELLNKLKSDNIVNRDIIDQKIGMISSINAIISNSLQKIDAAIRDRASQTQ